MQRICWPDSCVAIARLVMGLGQGHPVWLTETGLEGSHSGRGRYQATDWGPARGG